MTPGQAAYERWCELINPPKLSFGRMLDLQPWSKLKPATKKTWESVARAAIEAKKGGAGGAR